MASEPLLDLETLLAEIPGDKAAGEEEIPFEVKEQLDQLRIEIDPADYDPEDPRRPTESKRADWAAVRRLATDHLTRTSKHLLLAARLTEAITNQHGFEGLAVGLELLRRLVTECWDRIYPAIPEDGDLDYRAVPLKWLGDSSKNADFANTVRRQPLLGPFHWQNWKMVQEGRGTVSREEFDRAIQATPREQCQQRFDSLTRCIEELTKLSAEMSTRMASSAPAMSDLRAAISDCYTLAKELLKQKGPAPSTEAGDESSTGETVVGESSDSGRRGGVTTRAEAYRRLSEAADLLATLEPHSPIPYLVRRAVALGGMPFPQLMRALIRSHDVLNEMNRELGIKDDENNS